MCVRGKAISPALHDVFFFLLESLTVTVKSEHLQHYFSFTFLYRYEKKKNLRVITELACYYSYKEVNNIILFKKPVPTYFNLKIAVYSNLEKKKTTMK